MKLSYLVTCHNETTTLLNLLERVFPILGDDELVVLIDEGAVDNQPTKDLLSGFAGRIASYNIIEKKNVKILQHPLNNDYGGHKDWGAKKCSGDYIFQIDGDELPSEFLLGENLHTILESNKDIELIFVPRLNDFKGVTAAHAQQWHWKLTTSKLDGVAEGRPIVNWCDYQGRIFKNEPARIRWDRRLHEKLVGHTSYSFLPAEEDFALYHDKTIEKQVETNLRYNQLFSQQENQGHQVI